MEPTSASSKTTCDFMVRFFLQSLVSTFTVWGLVGRALHFAAATSQVGALRVLINSKADLRVRVNGYLAALEESLMSQVVGDYLTTWVLPRFNTPGHCSVQRQ